MYFIDQVQKIMTNGFIPDQISINNLYLMLCSYLYILLHEVHRGMRYSLFGSNKYNKSYRYLHF